jgi:DNA-binding transcriptional regulator YdaS (Cro superfamily)
MPDILPMTGEQALTVLVQCAGSQRRLASVLGVSEEHVSRWVHGRYPVPQWVVVVAEAMDQLPRKDWPERWSKAA